MRFHNLLCAAMLCLSSAAYADYSNWCQPDTDGDMIGYGRPVYSVGHSFSCYIAGDTLVGMCLFSGIGPPYTGCQNPPTGHNDNCPSVPNTNQSDADADGVGDVCDVTPGFDGDSDGVSDALDNCPAVANPDQSDADADGVGDVCDVTLGLDGDSDGVSDALDNCPAVANPDQADSDSDGMGNACDGVPEDPCVISDTDGDGYADYFLPCPDLLAGDDFESGSFSSLPWTSGGDVVWKVKYYFRSSSMRYEARSGAATSVGQRSWLELVYSSPWQGRIVFESITGVFNNPDFLFYIDGILQKNLKSNSWKEWQFQVDKGSHTYRWEVVYKAVGGYVGLDNVYLYRDMTVDAFPLNSAEFLDADNDTVGNNADWDDDNDGVPDTVDAEPLNAADTSEITLSLDGVYKGARLESRQQRSP